MPIPTLPIVALDTANTFRAWLRRTNNVIDLLNSNAVLVAGGTANGVGGIGAFTIGNTTETTSSLIIAGGKFGANATGVTLTGTSVFGANVTVNSSAANVAISSTAVHLIPSTETYIGGANLYTNSVSTFNGSVTLTATTPLTVGNVATFQSNVAVNNSITSSNTVYARSLLYNHASSLISATLSSTEYNNYSPADLIDAIALNINPDTSDISITGLDQPSNMTTGVRVLYLQNTNATYKITLRDANTSSTVNNRFETGVGDVEIGPKASISLVYSFATTKWRLVGAPPSGLISSLSVAGNVAVTGSMTVAANVAVDTNVLYIDTTNNRVGVNIVPTSPLHVNGAAVFNNTFSATGATNVLSTFGVTGAATFANTLSVSGGLTGAINALSTLGVTGAVNALSTLGVTGEFTPTAITETIVDLGSVTSTVTIGPLSSGTIFTAVMSSGFPLAITLPSVSGTAGKSFVLYLKTPPSGTTSAVTFVGAKWPDHSPTPTISGLGTSAGMLDIFSFVSDGTNWYGAYSQGYTV